METIPVGDSSWKICVRMFTYNNVFLSLHGCVGEVIIVNIVLYTLTGRRS